MPDNKALILEVIEQVEGEVKKIKSTGGKWWVILEKVAQLASTQTEKIATIDWTGVEKKEFALNLFEDLWFKYVNIKQIPDFLERPLVHWIASNAIEAFVSLMNSSGKWLHKKLKIG